MRGKISRFSNQVAVGGLAVILLLVLATVLIQVYGKFDSTVSVQDAAQVPLSETFINEEYKYGFKYPGADSAVLKELESGRRYLLEVTASDEGLGGVSLLFEVVPKSEELAILQQIRASVDIPRQRQDGIYAALKTDDGVVGGGFPGRSLDLFTAKPWNNGWSDPSSGGYILPAHGDKPSVVGFKTVKWDLGMEEIYMHLQNGEVLRITPGYVSKGSQAEVLQGRILQSINTYLK